MNSSIDKKIQEGDPWYVGSQFEWADQLFIRPIYERRHIFFADCIERMKCRDRSTISVLDAGCGDGYWLDRLSNIRGVKFTGVDSNPLRVERAKTAVPDAVILHADLAKFETDERFDIILLNQVIEHVEDDVVLLQKLHSHLRSDGVLLLGTTNEGSLLHRLARVLEKQALTDHVHFYTEKIIRHKILAAGFTVGPVMREVFFPGNERLYYWLLKKRWGVRLLEYMTHICPSQCSDYYFECRKSCATQNMKREC